MIRILKMRLLDFILLLVQYAFAKQVNPPMLNQLGLNYDSFIISNTTGCCGCSFEDTKYMDTLCGGQSAFINLVQNLMMSRCDISDPCRRLGRDDVPNEWYDFIVVGAGVAGPIIARRLSDNAWNRVLLIEAGPEEPTMTAIPGFASSAISSSLDWKYKTEPTRPHPTACLDTGGKCNVPRGKMISGTGAMHGMMYYRGHPEIYNKWAREGNIGWSYDEIEHYFQRAEDPVDPMMLSSFARTVPNGPVKIQHYSHRPAFVSSLLESASELGYRTSGLKEFTQTGFMVAPMTVEKGLRASTPKAYLRPVYNRNNLRVLTNARVLRVLINDYDMKAYGVELVDKKGQRRVIKCNKEVILTAGAMGSPQLLLNSGIGPREELNKFGIRTYKDLPVGQYFINHVSIAVPMTIKDISVETMTMQSVNEFLETRTGDLASTGLTQVTAFLESNYTIPGLPDLQVFFDGFSSYCPKTGMPNECTDGVKEPCPNRRKIVARPTVVIPESRGTVELRSANPLDLPLMYPNYFTNEKDMKVLIEGIKKILQLIDTPTMKKWDLQLDTVKHPLCTNLHFGSDAYWECYIRAKTGPENHQAGTCKMGPATDPDAVVDSQLRVYGVPNIRVADPSIFPYLPNSNPIAAIMMVAEKASNMIINSWKGYMTG
ncbi:glucose dehydrogenase [FAD, quinone]-like [Vespa velutina]|uniref:glucose dehydrogenase [FAD, quinone]-like n=1 Tax=Vespa velutina TaxID=202808 RepID=UPI001FB25309|nr:glucose dehydrogenase [FAD, quinone]-like [Vespa velutina]XP_047346247.1 glucose dehydrogenase [FAD, quinone]-like [Vespa velutina]XP_047346249.1 glucose dehydrogenase [FAD, quinone]-like [Vespa velutina]XP_047346250.1 glucose dehydrogenase [FAD, quinone]-like [Vespa velutina]